MNLLLFPLKPLQICVMVIISIGFNIPPIETITYQQTPLKFPLKLLISIITVKPVKFERK